ncbi:MULTISPECIES: hypothetical protein [Agathobaculum]|uniref:hypothetical protein n=1 Tax=Agathobaculum TaxID=2048137 RepID=UPI003562BB1C
MLASEMIATIKHVEKEHYGITQMYAKRIAIFQSENLPMTQGVEYDSAFYDFVAEMESVKKCKIYIPTAKKILNNWYLWAKDNLQALSKIEPFTYDPDPIQLLIKNDFRVDYKCFAESATEESIEKIKGRMPQNSELFAKLKAVADKQYAETIGERGFSYPYLVKVVAGFCEVWN